jgi:hypothetical protein
MATKMKFWDKSTFEFAKTLITDTNLVITEAEYNPEAFGSWFIAIDSNPVYRLLCDIKENWLLIQEKTEEEIFNGIYRWKDQWIVRDPKEEDLRIGVTCLKKIITGV